MRLAPDLLPWPFLLSPRLPLQAPRLRTCYLPLSLCSWHPRHPAGPVPVPFACATPASPLISQRLWQSDLRCPCPFDRWAAAPSLTRVTPGFPVAGSPGPRWGEYVFSAQHCSDQGAGPEGLLGHWTFPPPPCPLLLTGHLQKSGAL